MIKITTFGVPDSLPAATTEYNQRAADSLAAKLRKPADVLDAAAEEAARGRLGAAKLGLLVAAKCLVDALEAIDAEFARQYDTGHRGTMPAARRS